MSVERKGSTISRHIRSNVVGYIAIFLFALGGSAYATHPDGKETIDSADIIDGEVFSADVADDTLAGGGLAAADLASNSVGSSEVAFNSLTGSDIGPDSITQNELAPNSVTTDEVVNSFLTSDDLAPNSVGTSEVATDSVTGADIAEASLTGLDPEAVSPRKYAHVTGPVGASGVAVNEFASKGVADANVHRAAVGTYCFELGYLPDSVIGTAEAGGAAHTDRILTGRRGGLSGCAAGTDAIAFLRDMSTGAVDAGFFVQFESK